MNWFERTICIRVQVVVAFLATAGLSGCMSFNPVFQTPTSYQRQTWKLTSPTPSRAEYSNPQTFTQPALPYGYSEEVISPAIIESPQFGSTIPQSIPSNDKKVLGEGNRNSRRRGQFFDTRQYNGAQMRRTFKPAEEEKVSATPLLPTLPALDPAPVPVTADDRPPRRRRRSGQLRKRKLSVPKVVPVPRQQSERQSEENASVKEAPKTEKSEVEKIEESNQNSEIFDDEVFGGRLLGEIEFGPEIAPRNSEIPRTVELQVQSAEKEKVGNGVLFRIKIVNSGDKPIRDLVAAVDFGSGFRFPHHNESRVEQSFEELAPQSSKEIALTLTGQKSGNQCCRFTLLYNGLEVAWKSVCVELVD